MKIESKSKSMVIMALLITSSFAVALPAIEPTYAADPNPTVTKVRPNPAAVVLGEQIKFSASVADVCGAGCTKVAPTGTVMWDDGGAGGSFSNAGSCTLTAVSSTSSNCSIVYTAPLTRGPVTITAAYQGDSSHSTSSGTSALAVVARTHTVIGTKETTPTVGKVMTVAARVSDSSVGTKTVPTGTVSWSDGGAGGSFSSATCALTQVDSVTVSTCNVTYTPATGGSVTITGTYSGDSTHKSSFGTLVLTVNPRTTSTTVTPNLASVNHGGTKTFQAKVLDSDTGIRSAPTGTVSWSDGGAGGSFSSATCTLSPISSSASTCTVVYTAPLTAGTVTITGTYSGDSTHKPSSGSVQLTVT